MTTMAPGAEYTKTFKLWKKTRGAQGWDGLAYLIRNNRFLTGLIPRADEFLQTLIGARFSFDDQRSARTIALGPMPDGLRLYQELAIESILGNTFRGSWFPRGVVAAATGSGKTLMAASVIEMVQPMKIFFLVHRKDLLHQTVDVFEERFKDKGIQIGEIGDGVWNPKEVTISTVQTLDSAQRLHPEKLSLLSQVEGLFIDEAHLIAADLNKGNQFVRICGLFPNAFLRIGLTATPFLGDNYSNWLLEGVTGRTIYKIKNKDLIAEQYLSTPKIKMIRVTPPVYTEPKWQDAYKAGIVVNPYRNGLVVEEAMKMPKPLLILVIRTDQGRMIKNIFSERKYGLNVPFVFGNTAPEIRRKYVKQMKEGKLDILIASTIFDEGLDIPNLRSLILAGGGRSAVKGLQRIGRGLRRTVDKSELDVLDFFDEGPRVLKKHSKSRLDLWKEEGFEVEVVDAK